MTFNCKHTCKHILKAIVSIRRQIRSQEVIKNDYPLLEMEIVVILYRVSTMDNSGRKHVGRVLLSW